MKQLGKIDGTRVGPWYNTYCDDRTRGWFYVGWVYSPTF